MIDSLIIGISYIKDLHIKKMLGEAIMKLTGTSLKKCTLPLATQTVHLNCTYSHSFVVSCDL